MIEKYYEEELRYLYESGKEFALAHPDRAPFLNVDAVADRDPYVERLFEGFAFLCARIREKIDDSFPEFTHGLFNLMWPSLLHEIPSVSIVQFKPRTGFLDETRVLPRGSQLLSSPVGQDGVRCIFSTSADVRLHPITIDTIVKTVDTKGKATLTFTFTKETSALFSELSLSPLRLFFHAETPTALMLREYLLHHAVSVRISGNNSDNTTNLDALDVIRETGITEEDSLLPPDKRCVQGFVRLLEYFVYPEKFMFVDLCGFENMEPCNDSTTISYAITFDRDFPADSSFTKDNFRLFCAPAVNIFTKDAEPIAVTQKVSEYRVVADASCPAAILPHSIISITGIERNSACRVSYEPLYHFSQNTLKPQRTYTTRYEDAPDGRRNLFVEPCGSMLTESLDAREENLSLLIYATNGMLAREEIREGGIKNPGTDFPDFVSFTNITRPTRPIQPPKNQEYLWSALSHLGAQYTTLADAPAFRALLSLYDWQHSDGTKRRIDAVTSVTAQPVERFINGSALRGIEFTITITESHFLGSGDIHLFGSVCKQVLSEQVSINTFLDLVIICKPSGTVLRWNSRAGNKCLI